MLIGLGGFGGAIARYLLASTVDSIRTPVSMFPWGILVVNLLGCLLIGWILGLTEAAKLMSEEARVFAVTGFLGSFTTLSSFGAHSFELMRHGHTLHFLANIVANVVFGIGAVWLGYALSHGR